MMKKGIAGRSRKFLALCLSASMLFMDILPVMAERSGDSAGSSVFGAGVTEEQMKEALAQEKEIYPNGGFEFFEPQLTVEEGDVRRLVIVRRGGTEKEASVDFKAVDVSAVYGEDYLLTVRESDYVSKTLDGAGKPLSDLNTGLEIPEDEPETETYQETEAFQKLSESRTVKKKSSGSALQAARDTYLGEESSSLNWQEMDEAQMAEAEAQSAAYERAYDEFAGDMSGVSYMFTFQPGEYRKVIDIEILDDDLAESDEQVMFLLSNASVGEVVGTSTAYLNITDNDGDEKAVFSMGTDKMVVDRSEGTASIVINRVSGVHKIASVIVGTGSDTAVSGMDYEAVQKEVIFAQGVESQTVEIPLLNYAGAPDTAQFQVALDADSSFVQEGHAVTSVTLTNREPVLDVEDTAPPQGAKAKPRAASRWSDSKEVNVSASVSGSKGGWSGKKRVLSGIDLSTADSITITWRSNEGSYSYQYTQGSGCNKETKTATVNNRETRFYINGSEVIKRTDAFGSGTQTYNLRDSNKTTNAYLDLQVNTTGENRNATARVSRVAINYPGYQFTVENTEYTDGAYSNVYTEKIYSDSADAALTQNGHRYKLGNKIKIGEIQAAKNGSSQYDRSVTLHRSCDTVTFSTKYSSNTTSNNVKIKAGYSGNVYLAGYQLKKPGGKGWSPLINPEDIKFGKSFITNYGGYLHTGNEFVVRPVYRPFEARVMFQNTDTKRGSYANGFKTDEVLRCTTLDTIQARGIASEGYSVKSFRLGVHSDRNVHDAGNTPNQLAARGNGYYGHDNKKIISEAKRVADAKYPKVNVTTAVVNPALGNIVTFTPTGEFTYISPEYSVPTVQVKIDPKNNDKDKGAVVYTPQDGDGGKVLTGDKDTPMEMKGVTLNKDYTINAVTDDNYKAYFKNFTGDSNQDGNITTAEEQAVASYNFVRTASNGNAYTFRPVLDLTLIYYGFFPAVINRYEGTIDGIVALRDKPVFGDTTTLTAINGAQISVAGMTTASKADEHFGGVDGKGGDGYFALSSREFVSGENQTVNITYNNIHISSSQAVNAAGIYELDAYDTIGISQADAYLVEGDDVSRISPNDIANGDKTYRISIQTYSKNDTVSATKAVYSFYRKDGSRITTREITSDNGVFTLDFNPKSLGIPAGASMSVQFYDQNDVGYFEHDMGFTFAESLGILSFLSSFNFGGAEKAIELIGVIDSGFHFGWDGDIDKVASKSDDFNTKTISIGYKFSKEKDLTEEDEEKKEDVKEAAKDAGTTAEKKGKQKEAADAALDKGAEGAKQTAEIGASASIELSFGLEINICKSDKEDHKGEWYFSDMMLTATAEGGVDVTISYVTPIGIPVRVGIKAGASGAATMVVEQNYSKDEYYFSQITDTEAAKIDIFDFNMKKADRAFDAYGIFNIAPYLDLSAGAGFDFLNLSVGGRANFDMNFYTRSDQTNTGNVRFSAYIGLKILFFEKEWEIASTTVNMFGGARSRSVESMSGNADYTYESLGLMKADSRAYLEQRSEWQGESSLRPRSVAGTSGVSEILLQKGMNPNPDIQMIELPNGKYLAVFLDDNIDEDTYNCTHAYYTVGSGETWTEPRLIEADGTTDDAPAVFDLGDKGIYAAWSSADRKLTEEDTVISSLNSMNIHGAFFDAESETFGEIQEITSTSPYSYTDGDGTVIEDNVADVEPHISYDPASDRMLMFYTKIEYESTAGDDEGLVGDVAKPYSLIAYRSYDFAAGKWEDTYGAEEGLDEDYTKAWYGQRFLELAPLAVVKEELDAGGYWVEEPVIEAYQKASYSGADGNIYEQEPIIIESEAASYNGLGLYAYVLDYDGNKETEHDRDIFLQIYNYAENTFTHPIMITATQDIPESAISFGRSGNTTLLTYAAENTLYALNLSYIVQKRLLQTEVSGREFYYIDKTAPTGEEAEDDSVYMPPIIVAGENVKDVAGGVSDVDGAEIPEEDAAGEETEDTSAIIDYKIASTDDYVYAVWTRQSTRAKQGIDENSEEAQEAKNRVAESQIYVARYDAQEGIITSPVQVTDEEGANYGSIGCSVTEDGAVKMLAVKAGSKVETLTGTDGSGRELTQEIVVEDTDNTALTALDFTPVSSLEAKNLSIQELTAGTESTVSLELYNDGVETLSELTFTAKGENGEVIYTETMGDVLYGGRTAYISFPVALDEDAEGISFTYEVADKAGELLVSDSYREEIPLELDVTSFEASTDERGTITFTAEVTNNSRRKSGEQRVSISRKIEEVEERYTEITSFTTGNLLPGESKVYTVSYDYGSYDEMFATFITEGTEELKAVTRFRISTGAHGNPAETSLEMKATKEQRLRMSAVKKVTVLDGNYQAVGDVYKMDKGEITQLNTAVESIAYSGSRYSGMDDEKNYDKSNTAGLRVMYTTDNPQVLTVYDSGFVEASGTGTATVTAYVMPANNRFRYNEETGTVAEDNYATLPEEAMILKSFQVTVGNTAQPETPGNPSKPVPAPGAGTKVQKGKTYTAGGTKYKVTKLASGNKAGAVTLVKGKKAKKLTVPASIKLDGKSYAVTAVGTGAFKGYRTAVQAVIGKNVKKIAAKAFFGCRKLKKITVKSKSLSSVGKKAIYGINKKAVIKVPKAKLKAYRKKFNSKTGLKKTMKVKK